MPARRSGCTLPKMFSSSKWLHRYSFEFVFHSAAYLKGKENVRSRSGSDVGTFLHSISLIFGLSRDDAIVTERQRETGRDHAPAWRARLSPIIASMVYVQSAPAKLSMRDFLPATTGMAAIFVANVSYLERRKHTQIVRQMRKEGVQLLSA